MQQDSLKEKIRETAAAVLCLEPGDIPDNKRLADLGMDSIIGVELINKLNQTFKLNLEKSVLYEYPVINELVGFLRSRLDEGTIILKNEQENPDPRLPDPGSQGKVKLRLPTTAAQTRENRTKSNQESLQTLEKYFGALPPDLFERCKTLEELTQYFMENHRERLTEMVAGFPSDEPGKAAAGDKPDNVTPGPLAPPGKTEDIAVIGISGRYPMAPDLDSFWENLKSGKNCITEVPKDRWDYHDYYDPHKETPGKTCSKWGGFIDDVDKFDPLFFKISPREAARLDPQTRLLLEIIWNALEDAGYNRQQLNRLQSHRQKVGLFIGCMYHQYPWLARDEQVGAALSNMSYWSIVNRCSYFFNFKGPSIAIDTACSSSLTAVHMACESLRRRECEIAIAGGINLNLHPSKYLVLKDIGLLGSEGKSSSLGKGDGYVPGEGVGVVLLRPLSSAMAHRDHIYVVIKGSSVNHGGNTEGFTVPNPGAQGDLIAEVLEKTRIDPTTIGYVETSAAGSPLGDSLEIVGLNEAFRRFTGKKQFCSIGTVKSNIGHLEAAAGISQLTKVILQMKNKMLVPSINAEPLNSSIDLEGSPFYLQKECRQWQRPSTPENEKTREYPRRAVINSFGAGGSNAHLVVEEYIPPLPEPTRPHQGPYLIVLSARDEETLNQYAKKMLHFLTSGKTADNKNPFDIQDLAYTLQVGREAMEERLAFVVSDTRELEQWLTRFCQGKSLGEAVYRGKAGNNSLTAALHLEGEAGKEFLQVIFKNREFSRLAQLWVSGVEIDWKWLYPGSIPQRISLPTYPFARKRYWLDTDLSTRAKPVKAPGGGGIAAGKPTRIPGKEISLKQHVKEKVKAELVKVLGLELPEIDENMHFRDMGLDSVLGVELVKNLNKAWQINLKATVLYDYSTVNQLCRHLEAAVEAPSLSIHRTSSPDHQKNHEEKHEMKMKITPGQKTCKGLLIEGVGDIADVGLKDIVVGAPGHHEVQVLVRASALNFADLLCIKGFYPTMPDYPFVAGFQVSGLVTQTGPGVTAFKPGDPVVAMTGYTLGGHAQYVNTHENLVIEKPGHIDFQNMCGFPDAFVTAYHCLYEIGKIKSGDHILIQGAAGGVGLMAIQLAKLKNAVVYGTSSSPAKLEYLKSIGVDFVINYKEEDFYEKIMEFTHSRGVDVVLDTLSGDALQEGIDCLAPGGRCLEIAVAGLRISPKLDLSNMTGNQSFHSIDLRKLWGNYQEVKHYLEIMKQMVQDRLITPIVFKTFPARQVKEALAYIADRKSIGKVVLVFPGTEWQEKKMEIKENQRSGLGDRDIAVIGVSGQFPGARDLHQFWNNLVNGIDSIAEVPQQRWDSDRYYDPDPQQPNKTYCRWGGFLEDVDRFDPLFFSITPMEAELMDPQQRLFLAEAWKAVENAGYSTRTLSGLRCGVFAGVGPGDYSLNTMSLENNLDAFSLIGSSNSILTGRLSYTMDLKGPNMAIDTACSSSLLALHLGCQSIRNGESDVVIAGGVHIMTTPAIHIMVSKAGMLARDGACKTFDNEADGFVPGEAVGVVVMKSLKKALADKDHIYGVIKGSCTNQDGQTNGITAPSSQAQTRLESEVYDRFSLHPENIGCVEAHGTGTRLGDPIEVEALTNAYRKYTERKQYCAIGSVKTNIGHGMAAAGISGFIKALLCLYYKKLVPSLHYRTQNEHIDFQNSPFYVNTVLKDWKKSGEKPRQAAISSFGFSGTNVHMVLEETPLQQQTRETTGINRYYIAALSAKTSEALEAKIRDLVCWLQEQGTRHSLGNVSYTLLVGRVHFPVRLAVVVRDMQELIQKMESLAKNGITGDNSVNHPNPTSTALSSPGTPGPDPLLHQQGKNIIDQIRQTAQHSITDDEYKEKLTVLADLYLEGCDPDWACLFQENAYSRITLPGYPFARERYWRPVSGKEKPDHSQDRQEDHNLLEVLQQLKSGELEVQQADQMLDDAGFFMTTEES